MKKLRCPFGTIEMRGACDEQRVAYKVKSPGIGSHSTVQRSEVHEKRDGVDQSIDSLRNQRRSQYPGSILRPWESGFFAKLQIALKECAESEYWLELLMEGNYTENRSTLEHCTEVKKMLIASINTAKNNMK